MNKPALLSQPHAMTAAWFTEVLRHQGFDVTVAAVSSRPIGTGQSAHSERFELTYSTWDGRAPASLVAKLPAPDPTSRATGHVHGSYARELGFYADIAPTVDVPLPRCLYVDFDPSDSDFVLLLEDLAPAQQGDQMAGCSPQLALAAVRTIAGLHGPRWDDPSLRQHTFLSGANGSTAVTDELYRPLWQGFVERYADQLAPEMRELGERFLERYVRYANGFSGPRCVTHGDFRLDNVLIAGTPEAPSMHVVDWQTAGLGCGTSDVAYFLGAGLLPELRRKHEQDLLRAYVDALAQYGVRNYSFDDAWRDYRWYSFSGYVMAVVASILVVQTPRGDELFMTMAHRHGQHALDLDALALLDE